MPGMAKKGAPSNTLPILFCEQWRTDGRYFAAGMADGVAGLMPTGQSVKFYAMSKGAPTSGAGGILQFFNTRSGCEKKVTTPATATGLSLFAAGWP